MQERDVSAAVVSGRNTVGSNEPIRPMGHIECKPPMSLFCFMNTEGYISLSKMLLVCVSVLCRPQILTAMDLHP